VIKLIGIIKSQVIMLIKWVDLISFCSATQWLSKYFFVDKQNKHILDMIIAVQIAVGSILEKCQCKGIYRF
jgi:hypothetical protein